MRIYHGSEAKFTSLDESKQQGGLAGKGWYFSTMPTKAKRYGKHFYVADIPRDSIIRVKLCNVFECNEQLVEFVTLLGYDGIRFNSTVVLFKSVEVRKLG